MAGFSLPKDEKATVDPDALREFASGAKTHRTQQEALPWEQYDPEDIPRHNVAVRLNSYQLEILRYLAKQADVSQQKILNRILVPSLLEQIAEE